MKRIFLIIIFSLFLFGVSKAQWQQANGPYGGCVMTLEIDTTTNYLYAGTFSGGVFVSGNNGASWLSRNSGISNNGLFIKDIAIKGNFIFAGTYRDGIYLSANNGNSWTPVNTGLTNLSVQSLAINGNYIFAGTGGGMFVSSNNGSSWTEINNGLEGISMGVFSIALRGGDIFVGTGDGIYLSTDNGNSWRRIKETLFDEYVSALAVSGNNIFAGTTTGGIVMSSDNGNHWDYANNGLAGTNVKAIVINGSKVFAGTLEGGINVSFDSGSSWSTANTGLLNRDITTIALNGVNMFAGSIAGIFRSTNEGNWWYAVNNGLSNTGIQSINVSGSNVITGSWDGGAFFSSNNASNWSAANTGLTAKNSWGWQLNTFAINGSNIFAGTDSGIFFSNNNGVSWVNVNNGLSESALNVRTIVFSGNNIFAGTGRGGVYLSTNNGNTWTPVNNGLSGSALTITSIVVAGNNVLAGTRGSGIYLSEDNGNFWEPVNNGLAGYGLYVSSLAFDGNDIFAGTGSGIFKSTNNGGSWIPVYTGLPDSWIQSLVLNGSNILVRTSAHDVFLSRDKGLSWADTYFSQIPNFSNGTGPTAVFTYPIGINEHYIFSGSSGNGVWRRLLSDFVYLTLSPDSLRINSFENSKATFDISSTTSWTVSSEQAWLVPDIPGGYGDSTITLTAQYNPSASVRVATITVSGIDVSPHTITVTQDGSPLSGQTVSKTDVDCYGSSTGRVTVAASGGYAPYEYGLDGGAYQPSATFESLAAGNHIVTIRDSNLSTFNIPITISEPESGLSGSLTSLVNVSIPGGNDGQVTVAGEGGVPPYEYSLNSGSYQSSGVFGSLSAGSYVVTIRDANLCTTNFPVTMSVVGPNCSIMSKANFITPDKRCSPVTVTWNVSYSGVNDGGTPVSIRFDWDNGSVVNIPAVRTGPGTFEATANNVYVSAGSLCSYRPRATLVVNGIICTTSTQEQIVTVWDDDNHNGGSLRINPQIYPVCLGESANVRFQDLTQFNCVPPQERDNPNVNTRWVQFIYGTDITMTGTPVTINGINRTFPYSDDIFTLTGPVTGSGLLSDIIYVASDKLVGQYFEVTLRNWNYCNPYDDPNIPGPPADRQNGDHPPVATNARVLIVPYPDATINPVGNLCLNSPPVTLIAHDPGGIWSGPGVTGNIFNPAVAGVGNHSVRYEITNPNGCFDTDEEIITVSSCSVPTFSDPESVCLIRWYPLNGNSDEETGYGNDGIMNGAVPANDRFGNPGSALYFNGVDNSVTIPGYLPVANSFTICFWAFLERTDGYNNIISDGSIDYGGNDFLINFRNNSIGIRADKAGLPLNYEYDSPAEMTNLNLANRWAHVAWVMNPSGSLIYLDGIKIAEVSIPGTNEGFHDDHVTIGARHVWTGMDSFFQGRLDELRVYNCELTDQQISDIFNDNGSGQASVSTASVTNITDNSATSGGYIFSDGGFPVTARGVCWSISPNPTISDNITLDGSGKGSFTSSISGLAPGTRYFLRSYATNSEGTSYGKEMNFLTGANPFANCGTVTDVDGNVYNTVTIGSQCWMQENLKTTRFKDGSIIPLVTDSAEWYNLSTPGYCWNNNDEANYRNVYGAVYNWYSVNTGKLCPAGWHVPASEEWDVLADYLGGSGVAGGKLKETGTDHWTEPNTGATNETGFTALPGGGRQFAGSFLMPGDYGHWWCSAPAGAFNYTESKYISHVFGSLSGFNGYDERIGMSVRCLQGEPVTPPRLNTISVSSVTFSSAVSGGNISSDGGAAVTERGVCWDMSPNPTINHNKTFEGTGPGTFTSQITGLMPGTTYFIRAYATNSAGTAYGNEIVFTTEFPVMMFDGSGNDCMGSRSYLRLEIFGATPPFNLSLVRNGEIQAPITGYIPGSEIETGFLEPGVHVFEIMSLTDAESNSIPPHAFPHPYSLEIYDLPDASPTSNNLPAICNDGVTDITLRSITANCDFIYTATYSPSVTWLPGKSPESGIRFNGEGSRLEQNLAHTSHEPVVVTYIITPQITGTASCTGMPAIVNVTVAPVLEADPVPDRVLCNGQVFPPVVFTTFNTGALYTYTWTNSNPAIGLPASGTGSIPAFVVVNTGDSPLVSEITVTPHLNSGPTSCQGILRTFRIVVNPTPRVFPINAQPEICSGGYMQIMLTSPSVFSSGQITFDYTISLPEGVTGNISPGTGMVAGNDLSFSYENNADTVHTVLFYITPKNEALGCFGNTVIQQVSVHPNPVQGITITNPYTCDGGSGRAALHAEVSKGTEPYHLYWQGPMGFSADDQTDLTDLYAGYYIVTATDRLGCVNNIAINVPNLSASPMIIAYPILPDLNVSCNGGDDGTARIYVRSGVTSPYYYSLIRNDADTVCSGVFSGNYVPSDQTTYRVCSGLTAGNYELSVRDINGCETIRSIELNEPEPIRISFDASDYNGSNVSCSNLSDGSVNANVSGGSGIYSYLWIGPDGFSAPTEDISGLTPGTYTLNVTDGNGCLLSGSVILTASQPIDALLESSEINCFGSNDGVIAISLPEGGSGNYEYSIDGGSTWYSSGTFTGLNPGTYDVRIRDAMSPGCFEILNSALSLTGPTQLEPGVIGNNQEVCVGEVPSSLIDISSPTGGAGTYYYQWQYSNEAGGPFMNIPSATLNTYTPAAVTTNTTYYRRMVISGVCEPVYSNVIGIIVNTASAVFARDVEYGCTPLTVALTKDMTGLERWWWDFGDGSPLDSLNANPVHTFVNSPAGSTQNYNIVLRVRLTGGCYSEYASAVTVYPEADATFRPDREIICSGNTITFNALEGASRYFWDYGDGTSGYGTFQANHFYLNNTSDPVVYTVRLATTSFYGCIDVETFNITVMPVPVPQFIADHDSMIFNPSGNPVAFTNTTIAGNWNWLWSFGDGSSSTEMNPIHTYTNTGTYTVILSAGNAHCSDSIIHQIRIAAPIPVAGFDSIPSGCPPYYVVINNTSLNTDVPGTTFRWDFGDGSGSAEKNPVHTYFVPGIYRLDLTVSGPGGTSNLARIVTVFPPPAAIAGGSQSVCVGDTVIVSEAAFSNGMIQWTTNGNGILIGSSTLSPIYIPAPDDSGKTITLTMTVTGSGACGMLVDTAYYSVLVRENQTITFNSLPDRVYGDPSFDLTASAGSSLPVNFTCSDDSVITISGTTVTIKGAGTATIYAHQSGNDFYCPAPPVSRPIRIDQKPITVWADTVLTKTYGDADPVLSYSVHPGLEGTDKLQGKLSRDMGEKAGRSYVVNQGTLNPGPEYSLTFIPGRLYINPKPVVVRPDPGQNKTYGSDDPVLRFTIIPELIRGDVASGSLSRVSGENAGLYAINKGTLSLGQNYSLTWSPENFSINKAPLYVTADSKERRYLESNPDFEISYSGFVRGEDISVLDILPSLSLIPDTLSDAGEYPVTVSGGSDSNYIFNYISGLLIIHKADQQIITFNSLPKFLRTTQRFPLEAVASSGLEVTFVSSDQDKATISGNVMTIEKEGAVNIIAIQEGNQNWNPAPPVYQTVIGQPTFDNVTSLFTPNSDGMNDHWHIVNIEDFGEVEVKVYNRFGKLVYESSDYKNDWKGDFNGSPLPEASYYYIIKSAKKGVVKGVVNIVR